MSMAGRLTKVAPAGTVMLRNMVVANDPAAAVVDVDPLRVSVRGPDAGELEQRVLDDNTVDAVRIVRIEGALQELLASIEEPHVVDPHTLGPQLAL